MQANLFYGLTSNVQIKPPISQFGNTPMKPQTLLIAPAVCALLFSLATRAQAQLGPELYSLSHAFGATTTLRGYAMGGASATMSGPTSINPAQMAATNELEAEVRYGQTRFNGGTRFDATFVSVAVPLGKKDGLQILYNDGHSPRQSSFVSAVFPGSTQQFHEETLGFFYGRRLNDKLSLGIAGAPILRTNHRLDNLGAPGVAVDFGSKPELDHLNHASGRFGLDYQFSPRVRASAYYDNYWERATRKASPLLAPAGLVSRNEDFHETLLVGGIEVRATPRLSLVAERARASLSSSTFGTTVHTTRVGAEWEATRGLFLRVGRQNNENTYGAGYERGRFSVNAARVNNGADKQLGPLFGKGNHLI